MKILVFNCGSSSLKFDLLELDPAGRGPRRTLGRGIFEEIGRGGRSILIDSRGHLSQSDSAVRDHPEAARAAIGWLESITATTGLGLDAVAHRIVHGGPDIAAPVIADDATLRKLEAATEFAPLHNPPALATMRAVAERLPKPPLVVIADTIFHQTIPDYARFYALPRALAIRYGIRRFGFHGIGHAWMMERCAELAGTTADRLNLVTLHLGAGCSAAAIRAGRSVDTSMGLTPLEGLMMATRSGDIDPAIFSYLCEREGIAPARMEAILNHESGLLGVSGVSQDLREVESAASSGHGDAALAIEMFCYRIRKCVGAYLAALGSADAIVFGGGVGEHSARVRARVCQGLERLGVVLDENSNRDTVGREGCFSKPDSPIKLYVIPVDEELYMARAAARLVAAAARQ